MKKVVTVSVLAASVYAFAQTAVNDWENMEVNSRNRMPASSYVLPLADEKDAFDDAIEVKTPYKLSLNGDWKFKWVGDPARRPSDFWNIGFDDSRWGTIDVPSCVEMRGYGVPHYTNIRYPHKKSWPKILDRDTGLADFNPVSSYRRTFTLPENWDGREVILRFDGVYSAYYVWVNGKMVGYAEDSHLASEFNITDFVKKEGENLLAVQVFRWCDGSYLEDQDMFRFSGIYRDVTLWARPKAGIADFVFTSKLDSDYKNAEVSLKFSTYGADAPSSAALYDAEGKKVLDFVASAAKKNGAETVWSVKLDGVNLWSAEKPYLYTLVMKSGSDIRAKKVGFKEQKVVGNKFYVNGKLVKLKGVNRHETDPENGRTVSLDLMIRDIELMKLYNINTVRTCHYPDHHLWYDLCDRYGIYVIAEANVEGHEYAYGKEGLGCFKEWEHSIVERNLRNVLFFRNHPSVTMWSMGNETGHGICFKEALKQVKTLDPSRVTHWERGNADAEVDSSM
ncbi:MAG: beta-galactosidase, partial [Kiritimatiellae bacterium]|nr:beta-galactosidase [Kiritimatiellia bacterium]